MHKSRKYDGVNKRKKYYGNHHKIVWLRKKGGQIKNETPSQNKSLKIAFQETCFVDNRREKLYINVTEVKVHNE